MSKKKLHKLRVLVLCHEDLVPPDSIEGLTDKEIQPWKTEFDVVATLRDIGHDVQPIGLYNDLGVIRRAIDEQKPHIAFNLLEEFHGYSVYDHHVVAYLELKQQRYTGCNPRGLMIAHDKALAKQILIYHRIPVPAFAVFPKGRRIRRPKRLPYPLIIKSISEEGSAAISQSSLVYDDERFVERVQFVHEKTGTSAIAEQYIPGREIYMSVIGNDRLQTFTPWELFIERLPAGAPFIATGKVKWDYGYQEKVGVTTNAAKLPPDLEKKLRLLASRIYRLLSLTGYARLDFRMNEEGKFYLLEANPNPNISYGEDFAEAAEHSGIRYADVLQKIVYLGLRYQARF